MTTGPHLHGIDQVHRLALLPSTMRTYRRAFAAFERWSAEHEKSAMPASPESIVAYLKDLAKREMQSSTIRVAHAAIADAHLRSGRKDIADDKHVKKVLARVVKSQRRSQVPARPLTAEDLWVIRTTPRIPRKSTGRMPREEAASVARARGLVDTSLVSVMRDGRLRRSEAAALRWGDLTTLPDGTGRISINSASGDAHVAFIGRDATSDLLAIRPEGPRADNSQSIFGLSASHIGKRVREAAVAAGLGDGYTGDSCRRGMAHDVHAMFSGRTSGHQERYQSNEAAGRGAVAAYYGYLMIRGEEDMPTPTISP